MHGSRGSIMHNNSRGDIMHNSKGSSRGTSDIAAEYLYEQHIGHYNVLLVKGRRTRNNNSTHSRGSIIHSSAAVGHHAQHHGGAHTDTAAAAAAAGGRRPSVRGPGGEREVGTILHQCTCRVRQYHQHI